jgi:beta-galactosidase
MTFRFFFSLALLFMFGQMSISAQSERSLNGQWEIIFDDQNEGRDANWMQSEVFAAHPDRQTIEVPSAWETIQEDYEGVAFYKKTFDVPATWENKVIRLQFGAVNYLSEVWLNDEVVGFHEGGFTSFEFRVDEMIKIGESNVLTLRIVGPITLSDKQIDGIGKMETAQWRGGLTGGIWQDVKLVATGATYVEDVFIQPNIHDNTATFQITLDHTAIKGATASVSIALTETSNPTKEVVTMQKGWILRPGKNEQEWKLEIPNAQYWSPDNPHLYHAKISVSIDDEVSDTWSQRFGMRALTIQDKDFYLNGKRIYIKAAFFEGLYPNGIAYPDSKEMARKEIQLAKDAGFNMIRPWRRPPVPMWLDLADEMGVLVVGSPALECMTLPLSTPYLPSRVENEVRRSILRDRNRACIVQWELFNELHRPVLKQLMRPMAMLARDLDPTRLILDESGGWAFGANMYLPNDYEPTKFNDIHNYPGPFINKFHYEGYLSIGLTEEEKKVKGYRGSKVGRNVVPGLMSYVSELGYGSLPNLTVNNERFQQEGNPLTPAYRYHERLAREQRQVLKESGFGKMYPEMEQFYLDQQAIHGTANKRMLEAVRSNPEVDGYCIHALIGGDWVLGAGLIDLWRQPKGYVYEATKAANQARIVSIRMHPRNVYAEKGAKVEITGINDLDKIDANLLIDIVNSKGRSVYKKRLLKDWETGVSSLFQSDLATKKWKGSHTVKVRLTAKDGRILTENSYAFDVFREKDLQIKKTRVALSDLASPLATFLERKGIEVVEFSSATPLSTPVFVTKTPSIETADQDRFARLQEFARRGGTVIYIEGVKETIESDHPVFPFTAMVHPARGLWTCIPHLVHKHPLFAGLPANTMMRDIYENVWATTTLRDLTIRDNPKVETIVGSIGFDWFSREHKMHYSGPGASWWGSDVVEIPMGKGHCIVSQLRLIENLDKDPVADKILANLIKYQNNNSYAD